MALAQYLLTTPAHSRYSDSLHIYRAYIDNPFSCTSFSTQSNKRKILGQVKVSTPHFFFPNSYKKARWRFRVFYTGEDIDGRVRSDEIDRVNMDAMLAIAEVLCIAPSAILAIGCTVYSFLSNSNLQTGSLMALASPLGAFMNRILFLQIVFLVGALVIGALIRRRQWQRISRDSVKLGGSGFNLIERIEKLEEDLRSSTTIIRVLSRQLEKLGIKFRVTRKALKEPITETAALAQKNSEATRALAMQEDILEKELGEIQKVLLAMQEQQKKQLELILAIGKAGKMKGSRRDFVAEEQATVINKSIPETKEVKQTENQAWIHKESNNERVSS